MATIFLIPEAGDEVLDTTFSNARFGRAVWAVCARCLCVNLLWISSIICWLRTSLFAGIRLPSEEDILVKLACKIIDGQVDQQFYFSNWVPGVHFGAIQRS